MGPLAETNVEAVATWLAGEPARGGSGGSGGAEFFRDMGRGLIACLLADLMWDPAVPRREKTLRRLRRALVIRPRRRWPRPVPSRPARSSSTGSRPSFDAILRRLGAEAVSPEVMTGGAASAASSSPAPESYLPGAVAIARAAPREARRLGEVPADSVGGFVYEGGAIGLGDLSDRGVRYTGLAGVEFQGWLRSAGTGRVQLAADLRVSFGKGALAEVPCLFEAWLEDQAIGSASQAVRPWDNRQGPAALSLVLGTELRPGLYKLRAWIACAASSPVPPRVEAELLLKSPGELNLRAVTGEDLLYRPG